MTPVLPYIGVVFPLLGPPPFLFLDEFEGSSNVSIAIKCSSTAVSRVATQYPYSSSP